jgi:hypothetical protein
MMELETKLEAKHYDTIMDCLDEFDFERVHEVMKFLNWTWSDIADVPEVSDLRKFCRKYLQNVIVGALERKDTGGEYIEACGGFRFESKMYPDDFLWVRMSFDIADWDNAE